MAKLTRNTLSKSGLTHASIAWREGPFAVLLCVCAALLLAFWDIMLCSHLLNHATMLAVYIKWL